MVYGGYMMAATVHELRSKPNESEKITINLGFVDLGHVDLLVREGFYSNRTDFIRTAIRNLLDRHSDTVKQSVARNRLELGLRHYTREDLEAGSGRRPNTSHPGPGIGQYRRRCSGRIGVTDDWLNSGARCPAHQSDTKSSTERTYSIIASCCF